MELVLAGAIGDETATMDQVVRSEWPIVFDPYLSSSPPSFRTMLRREKTVPKMSFASSSAVRFDCSEPGATPCESDVGRAGLPPIVAARGSQRRL